MKSDEAIFIELAEVGRHYFIDNIKLLLYKTNPDIFELIDFEDERIYQEPLLFAYFNFPGKSDLSLDALLYGYIEKEKRPSHLPVKTDDFGRIYLPNFGWLITNSPNKDLIINTALDGSISLSDSNGTIDFTFEAPLKLESDGPEILKHPIALMDECYIGVDGIRVKFDVTHITEEKLEDLQKAWNIMQELLPDQYELIKKMTPKMVIFNVTEGNANSYATRNAQGTGFFNAYQKEYNEVFFIDDIAHQTGHVIFHAATAEPTTFLKLPPDVLLDSFLETPYHGARTVYVLFHAMYTYYTTLKFLDQALSKSIFDGQKQHEAMGRMVFYLNKYKKDYTFLEEKIGIDQLFTADGKVIIEKIHADMLKIRERWFDQVKHLNVEEQPYNFTYSIFESANSLNNLTY